MNTIKASSDVMLFYGWWQLSVCLFAFIALFAIWWHIGRIRQDFGQVFLAVSVLCWSCSGLVEILFASSGKANAVLLDGLRSIFSLFNSLFILLALPWFKYLPDRLEPLIKSRYWHFIIGLPFVFSLLPTMSKMWSGQSYALISELDVYFAFLTLSFLAGVLWTSFQKRRLNLLAYLSLICIGLTFVAQLYKLTDADVNLILFSAIFKTSLIMIFFALALSWVKELTENLIPPASSISLHLYLDKKGPNRISRCAKIHGIPGIEVKAISLSPGNYALLHKFATKRLQDTESWLEIRPKETGQRKREYDINDHNELKRLLSALLDGLFGEKTWSKEQHYIPLKQSFFELSDKRERKIRLRIPKSKISIEPGVSNIAGRQK